VLEVWYSLPPPSRRGGLLADDLRPATLEEATPPRRCYWQLVLTAQDHLLSSSTDLASEMAWQPGRWLSGPQPILNQGQLEDWIQCSRQDPLPAGVNAYLFGALAQTPRLPLVVASRRLVLILAAGLTLTIGLSLIYLPVLRKATPLMLAAIALGGLSLAFPDAALLLGRAALLGLAVTFAIGVWRWLAWGPVVRAVESRSSMAAPARAAASSTTLPRADRGQPPTTATAPAAMVGEPQP
jgi:hypothetical protein